MSKTKQVLILAIIVATAAAGSEISINPFGGSSVKANQGVRSGVQKWEHCEILGVSSAGGSFNYRGVATIRYFRADGWKDEIVEFVPDISQRNDYRVYEYGVLSKAIAKLGDDGWEMVLKEPDTENKNKNIFYFKRPKQ